MPPPPIPPRRRPLPPRRGIPGPVLFFLACLAFFLVAATVAGVMLLKELLPPHSAAEAEGASTDRRALRDGAVLASVGEAAGKPVASLRAHELWDEYEKSALAADRKYRGKYVEVTGAVVKVRREGDSYLVGLEVVSVPAMTQAQLARLSPKERQWFREGYPPNVVCRLRRSAEKGAAEQSAGGMAKLVGKVIGSKEADVWRGMVVELEDTRPVE